MTAAKFLLLLAFFPAYQVWDLCNLYLANGVDYHLVAELFASVAFMWILLMFARERQRAADELTALTTSATAAQRALSERGARAQAATKDFLVVIRDQFDAWKLTASERDVALLLIKGLSLDEIAAVRDSRPKTVRQHATAVYAKAGVDGRHQLAAYFLEDLLAPASGGAGGGVMSTGQAKVPADLRLDLARERA